MNVLGSIAHKRDLAVWRLYGAAQIIAAGSDVGVAPADGMAALRRVVAECAAEIEAAEGAVEAEFAKGRP